jgi:hypothetical protein
LVTSTKTLQNVWFAFALSSFQRSLVTYCSLEAKLNFTN